jgi:hypothetical protein
VLLADGFSVGQLAVLVIDGFARSIDAIMQA